MDTPPTKARAWPTECRWLVAIAAIWGFAEATFFFVVPDVLLTFVAARSSRLALRHIAAITLGAVIGGGLLFAWAARAPQFAIAAVHRVPFIPERMFDQAEQNLTRYGVWGVAAGPTAGVPYKVYAMTAPPHASLPIFTLVSIPARAYRLLIIAGVAAVCGWLARRFTRTPDRVIAIAHAVLWTAFYVWYWMKVGGS